MSTTSATTISLSVTSAQPRHKRRLTTSYAGKHHIRSLCQPLPSSIEALDLSPTPAQVLATIRLQVLSYLADLETRLSLFESPISAESLKSKGESTVEEARAWARTGLEMLARIRSDVSAHLPELHLETVPSMEEFVKSHMPDAPSLDDMRARLPDLPEAIRSRLPDITMSDMRSRLDDVRSSLSDIDFNSPLEYIPTLSEHLQTLQSHLSSFDLPQSFSDSFAMFTDNSTLGELLERVLSSDFISGMSSDMRGGEDMLERAAIDVGQAIRRSLNGSRLIYYADLPKRWRNNRFVAGGYR